MTIEPTESMERPPKSTGDAAGGEGNTATHQIGPYKILKTLGEGGMGVVYLAEQAEPIRRRVALKLIKLGMDSKQAIARFESERQALALMNHPNVAKVLDAGTTAQGRLYFVMEHVPGVPITDYCDQNRLTTEERLSLFTLVCHAVQHAHQKGIIHRDLKPSNVLVTVEDDKPVPKVIDFGIAKAVEQKLTDKTLFTELGQLVGTPAYMSPEQADLMALDIDTRTDIYSLGVMLYQLLSGSLPFEPASLRRAALAEIQRIIREDDPPKPSTRLSSLGDESGTVADRRRTSRAALEKQLRGDLDWIVMKCLEKDRTRRYETANSLALDIGRHLCSEPVLASPPTAGYRLKKFVRRNRRGVAAAGVIALILVMATVVSIGFGLSEAEQRRIASQRADELKVVTEFQQSMLREIDVQQMGRGIISDLRQRVEARLTERIPESGKVAAVLSGFDEAVQGVNATNLALKVVDENVLSRAVETIHSEFADRPLVRAALEQTLADTYREIGLYERATPLQQASLRTRRNRLGSDHPDTLASINSMGVLLKTMGKNEEALSYYREALQGRRRVNGDDHPDTLASISNMGLLLKVMGNNEEALPYYREALQGRRRVSGDDNPDTLIAINNMGVLLKAMGKYQEALPYFHEALEGKRRVLGDDHPNTLTSINNMGFLFVTMGQNEQALPYYREALEGRRRVLGDEHPNTLNSINNMGFLLKEMGKHDEALSYYREALDGRRRVLGDDHPDVLQSLNNVGAMLKFMGRHDEALPYDREALDSRRRVLGDDHPDTLVSFNNMGVLLNTMGRPEEALPYFREAMNGSRRVLGNDHPHTLVTIHHAGQLLRGLGRLSESEALGAEAVAGARRSLPEGHWYTATFLNSYGMTLLKLERYEAAETALLEAHDVLDTTFGPEHERTGKAIKSVADLYTAWDAAEPDQDHAAKATEWRAQLEALQAPPKEPAAVGEPKPEDAPEGESIP